MSALLLLILIGITVHTFYFWDHEYVHYGEQRSKYSFIDPARHLISQEHFLSTLQPLRERVHSLIEVERDLKISVYIEFLNTGANISINQDSRFWPASLAKVPIAMAVMGTIEREIWTLDQRLTLEDADRSTAPSAIHANPTGTQFTVRELVEELLIRSDNTAYRILLHNLPVSEINTVSGAIGLEDLFDEGGEVSAREYSRIFRSLYTANYLNREHSQFLLEILNRAEWKNFLREPVPASVAFPHKYGVQTNERTYSDSGIVYIPNRPYLITVMIEAPKTMDEGEAQARAEKVMHALSNMAFEYFTNAQNVLLRPVKQ